MRYEFHPEALEEYQEAALYYVERDPGLAPRFVEAVEDAIQRILEAPTRWRVIDEDVRRCLTRVFPYGVLYTIEPHFILIVAERASCTAVASPATGSSGYRSPNCTLERRERGHSTFFLLYGAGLRLMECCRLRVKDVDFSRD